MKTDRFTPERPWMGLRPFTESSQAFFFGRDDEIRDMYLRVREHTLTILYGQSGLGKSSLLSAGLIPKLRVEGYSPVVIKLDFDEAAGSLVEQVHRVLPSVYRSNEQSGSTLWEVFHLKEKIEAAGGTAPVIIFDQFEEVFTLGRSSAARKESVDSLLGELAGLIENCPPEAVSSRFEKDGEFARRFEYGDQKVKVVFALREDYLSDLETWRHKIPSLMRNRMPLHLLNGPKALEAAVRPGKMGERELISDSVGAQIVRFVAKKDDTTSLESIEAVPPLLSLVCSEMNEARLGLDSPGGEITSKMVEQQGGDILQEFYDRSFSRFPDSVREYVEDRMVTQKGHRNPVAREDAVSELSDKGVSEPGAVLDSLIDSRLLSAEVRGGTQRLELTHDVLTPLAQKSRSERKQVKEAARIRRQRNRLAVYVGIVSILALLSTGFGWMAWVAMKEAEFARKDASRAVQKVEAYQFAEGEDWLSRATIANEGERYFEAAMLAGKSVGFENFGRDANLDHPRMDSIPPLIREGRNPTLFGAALQVVQSNFELASIPLWMHTVSVPHENSISAITISGKETILATAATGGVIRFWSAENGDFIKEIVTGADSIQRLEFANSKSGTSDEIYGIADGNLILGWSIGSTEETLRVEEETAEGIAEFVCSSSGQLAILTKEGRVILRNGASGIKENHMELSETKVRCTAICFVPDSSDLILGYENGDIIRVDTLVSGGAPNSALIGNDSYFSELSASKNGLLERLRTAFPKGEPAVFPRGKSGITCLDAGIAGLVAAGTAEGPVLLWNSAKDEELTELIGHQYPVQKTSFINDGEVLLSSNGMITIRSEMRKWDLESRKTIWSGVIDHGNYNWVSSEKTGKVLLATPSEVEVWSLSEKGLARDSEGNHVNGKLSMVLSGESSYNGVNLAMSLETNVLEYLSSGELFALRDSFEGVGIFTTVNGAKVAFLDHPRVGWMRRSGSSGIVTMSGESIRHWDLKDFRIADEIPTPSSEFDILGLSPRGTYLARKDRGGVRIFDAKSGTERFFIGSENLEGEGIGDVIFNDSENLVLALGIQRAALVWNLEEETPVSPEFSFDNYVTASVFHPNGGAIATGTVNGLVEIRTLSGEVSGRMNLGDNKIVSLTYSTDGTRLLIGTDSGNTSVWSVAGQVLQRFPKIDFSPSLSIFLPDGHSVLERNGQNTVLWAAPPEYGYTAESITWIACSPDGKQYATGDALGYVSVVDQSNGELLARWKGHESSVTWVEFSPDGSTIATASLDGTAKLWNKETGQLVADPFRHSGDIMAATFHPAKPLLATCATDETIKLWSTDTGEPLHTMSGGNGALMSLAFSADGSMLAAGHDSGLISLWNSVDGSFSRSLEGHRGLVLALHFGANEHSLASLDNEGNVALWDLHTDHPAARWKQCRGGGFNLDFDSSYSALYIAGAGAKIYRWKVAASEQGFDSADIPRASLGVSCLAVGPDSNRVFYGTFGGGSGLFSLEDGVGSPELDLRFRPVSSLLDLELLDLFTIQGNGFVASKGSSGNLWQGSIAGPLNFATNLPWADSETDFGSSDPEYGLAMAIDRGDVNAAIDWWKTFDSRLKGNASISESYWKFLFQTIAGELEAPRSGMLMDAILEQQRAKPFDDDLYRNGLEGIMSEMKDFSRHGVTENQLSEAVSLSSEPALQISMAGFLRRIGNAPAAKRLIEGLVATEIADSGVLRNIGEFYWEDRNFQEFVDHFPRLADPTLKEMTQGAYAASRTGENKVAENLLSLIQSTFPGAESTLLEGFSLLNLGQIDEAHRIFMELSSGFMIKDPDNFLVTMQTQEGFEAIFAASGTAAQRGEATEAAGIYRLLREGPPNWIEDRVAFLDRLEELETRFDSAMEKEMIAEVVRLERELYPDSYPPLKVSRIFETRCRECHHPKTEDEVPYLHSLSLVDELIDYETIVPGEPLESQIFNRISLPRDSRKRMPRSKGSEGDDHFRPVLSDEEIDTIEQWTLTLKSPSSAR